MSPNSFIHSQKHPGKNLLISIWANLWIIIPQKGLISWDRSPGPLDFHESGQITKVLKPELTMFWGGFAYSTVIWGERPGRGRYNSPRIYGL